MPESSKDSVNLTAVIERPLSRHESRLGAIAFWIDVEAQQARAIATASRQRGDLAEAEKYENVVFTLGEAASLLRDARDK